MADFEIVAPAVLDASLASELHEYARMIRGEVLTGTWNEFTAILKDGVDRDAVIALVESGGPLVIQETRVVTIDGHEVDLGIYITAIKSLRVADPQDEDRSTLRLEPGIDPTCTTRLSGSSDGESP